MDIQEWRSKREWNMKAEQTLNPAVEVEGAPGFIYPDGSVILMSYSKPGTWYTIVGRSEMEDLDLSLVEVFLWNEHSMYNFEPHINEDEENPQKGQLGK